MSVKTRKQNLHPIEASHLHARRERVFLIFAGLFLGSMTMLNILGTSRFIDMSFELFGMKIPFILAVGVLPYPLTFLCTDFISELYGRKRANFLVWVGFFLNIWVLFILWIGGLLPPTPQLDPSTGLPGADDSAFAFYTIRKLAMGAVLASMVAYLAAQFVDVYLFHFWKRLTKGKHLWLRNNGSTLVSQFLDMFLVITITHFFVGHESNLTSRLIRRAFSCWRAPKYLITIIRVWSFHNHYPAPYGNLIILERE